MTRPYLSVLAEAASQLGGMIAIDPVFQHTGTYTSPDKSTYPLFGNALGVNSDAAAALSADKTYTIRQLDAAGVNTPTGVLALSPVARKHLRLRFPDMSLPADCDAETFAASHDYHVYLKPNAGKAGEDVSRSHDKTSFGDDLHSLFERHSHIRLEAPLLGEDYRVLVLDGRARAVYQRRPFGVVGNGQDTITTLLEQVLTADKQCGFRGLSDPALDAILARRNIVRTTIPDRGRFVPLRNNANLSTGGSLVDLSHKMPIALCDIAVRAASAVGLRYAGVDLISPDPEDPALITVLEVNSSPGLDGFVSHGAPQWALARSILRDALAILR